MYIIYHSVNSPAIVHVGKFVQSFKCYTSALSYFIGTRSVVDKMKYK
jgi:hypothetical protein